MKCEIDGSLITNEVDFHLEISRALGFGEYYGRNLAALWDTLSSDVERPVVLVWRSSEMSRSKLGDAFDKIVGVFSRVKAQGERWGLEDRFDFVLQ
jgi:ribonuclease inhibitor